MDILAATSNPNKLLELQTVAREFGVQIISPQVLYQEKLVGSPPPEVQETGSTYQENALLKAQAYCEWSGRVSLADDSGLEVDALGGEPGLYSARYLRADATYPERIADLASRLQALEELGEVVDRSARYCCSLVLLYPQGRQINASATLAGKILNQPRGEKGFGYDPIVLIDELGKTLAEVDFDVTCQVGFRGKALRRLLGEEAKLRPS